MFIFFIQFGPRRGRVWDVPHAHTTLTCATDLQSIASVHEPVVLATRRKRRSSSSFTNVIHCVVLLLIAPPAQSPSHCIVLSSYNVGTRRYRNSECSRNAILDNDLPSLPPSRRPFCKYSRSPTSPFGITPCLQPVADTCVAVARYYSERASVQ